GSRNAFDLDSISATHADIYILPARTDAGADTARAARDHAAEQNGVTHFLRRSKFGPGDSFGQRHAKTIGSPDDLMAFVVHFTARIFFDAQMRDREFSSAKGKESVHTNDSSALETGGNGAVEVLLSGDVDFIDDVHVHHQTKLDRDIDSFLV